MKENHSTHFKKPQFSVDSVLFTVLDKTLKVLLVKRANSPFHGRWGLPGGFVDIDKDDNVGMTARRKLIEKTGLNPRYLEQLQVFSGMSRDPRGFSITSAYYALVTHEGVKSNIQTVEEARWIDISTLPSLAVAFDHKTIIETAHQRLQQNYTN